RGESPSRQHHPSEETERRQQRWRRGPGGGGRGTQADHRPAPRPGLDRRHGPQLRTRLRRPAMKVEDYYTEGRRAWFRLHEKGGKRHKVPAHHNAEKYVDAYLDAAGIAGQKKTPLFRSLDTHRKLTDRPMDRNDALRMIKRRAKAIGLSEDTCCHTFRATGITAYL